MDNVLMKSALQEYDNDLRKEIERRRSIIYIQTDDYISEENKLKIIFKNLVTSEKFDSCNINIWSFECGKKNFFNHDNAFQQELRDSLSGMLNVNTPSILIIRGLYFYLGGLNGSVSEIAPNIVSLLYDFYYENERKEIDKKSMIFIESPKFVIPFELKGCLFTLEPPYPNEYDILEELGLNKIKEPKYNPKYMNLASFNTENKPYKFTHAFFRSEGEFVYEDNKKKLVSILKGMRLREIQTLLSYNNYVIENTDLDKFRKYKKQLVKDSGLLRVEEVPANYYDLVGDIDGLLKYVDREKTIIDNRINYNSGMPLPKGLLLVGPPGCGKSETSKAIASKLEMPLYSLDMGRLLGGLMGESEHNFEKAIAIAEAAQPCVLRIDEIEKAFAGSGSKDNSETLTRIVGFFLTWMQERKSLVYIVATANNLEQLRPEFLRKGRWDEIFYLSYPNPEGMCKILNSSLNRFHLKCDNIENIREEFRNYYSNNENNRISGAEIYDLVEQIYKQIFQKNPTKFFDTIPSKTFIRMFKEFNNKKTNQDIDRIIDNEIIDLKLKYSQRLKQSEQETKIKSVLEDKYTDQMINQLIDNELISYEISAILNNNVNFERNKSKIKTLLKTKYVRENLINEELSNFRLNSCTQSDSLNKNNEKEIRTLLRKKYEDQNSEESYKSKGYKSASTWKPIKN